jgi:hypothetical protein
MDLEQMPPGACCCALDIMALASELEEAIERGDTQVRT